MPCFETDEAARSLGVFEVEMSVVCRIARGEGGEGSEQRSGILYKAKTNPK
jgi:hypothetical protein